MSTWAQIEGHIYFKEKVTIEQLSKLHPSLQIVKETWGKKKEYLSFKDEFNGSEGGLKTVRLNEDGKRLYFDGGLRDVIGIYDSDGNAYVDIFEEWRDDWRKVIDSWIKLIKKAKLEASISYSGKIYFTLDEKHIWKEQTIYYDS